MSQSTLICVVDDQADFRLILQQLFKQIIPAYPVRFFASGQALLEALSHLHSPPGLILLDRHMPHLNGYQALVELKAHTAYKKIPVVMMSADASTAEMNECYEAGANSFLVKQLDFPVLNAMIQGICRYWVKLNQEPIKG